MLLARFECHSGLWNCISSSLKGKLCSLAGQHCHSLFRREPGLSDAKQDFLMKETAAIGQDFELNGFGKYMVLVTFVEDCGNYKQFNLEIKVGAGEW